MHKAENVTQYVNEYALEYICPTNAVIPILHIAVLFDVCLIHFDQYRIHSMGNGGIDVININVGDIGISIFLLMSINISTNISDVEY